MMRSHRPLKDQDMPRIFSGDQHNVSTQTEQTTWQEATDTHGMATREFIIERGDKRPVTGALWLPPQPRPGGPLMLCGHGASGNRYQAPISYLAGRFVREMGYAVLSLDGPVHGLRQVGPGGRQAFWPEWEREACIDDMTENWQLAIEIAHAVPEVGRGQLAYFGLSMGSIFGVPLVASRDDVVAATLGLLGTSGPHIHSYHGRRLLADAARIHCPLLFLMQLEDELFDRGGYLDLFDAFASPDKRLHANPGLHPEIPAEEIGFAFDFLCQHLEGKVERRIINPLAE